MTDHAMAIAAVTSLLVNTLSKSGVTVIPGKPNKISEGVFLYLYGVHVDEYLRNTPLEDGGRPPLWLVLKYLLFTCDPNQQSSLEALTKLGQVLRAIHSNEHLRYFSSMVDMDYQQVLEPLIQEFKLTIEDLPVDTVGRILSTNDTFFSCGIGLQVRPVPIYPDALPQFSQLVGIDYTQNPSAPIPPAQGDGRHLTVDTMASPAFLTGSDPVMIALDNTQTDFLVRGEFLAQGPLDHATLEIDGADFKILRWSDHDATVSWTIDEVRAAKISAGVLEARLKYQVDATHFRYSSSVPLRVVPTVTNIDPPNFVERLLEDMYTLQLTGSLLGTEGDVVTVALLRDGRIFATSEQIEFLQEDPDGPVYQSKILAGFNEDRVTSGPATVIVRVNGQQAFSVPQFEVGDV